MSIDVICPACKKTYRVEEGLTGKTARCLCGQRLIIPAPLSVSRAEVIHPLDEKIEPTKQLASERPNSEPLQLDEIAYSFFHNSFFDTAFSPLRSWLKRTRSPLVKLVIGVVTGAAWGFCYVANTTPPEVVGPYFKYQFVLLTAAMGLAASGMLITADAMGKRSFIGRWLTVIVLLILVASGVVGSFAYQAYRMDQQELAKQKAKHSNEYEQRMKEGKKTEP